MRESYQVSGIRYQSTRKQPMPGNITESYNRVEAADRKKWRAWLGKNHARSPGVWLVFYKKASGTSTVRYDEAVEEALCFGWIDSQVKPVDERRYRQLFTPRKPKSVWSKLNKDRVQRMIAEDLMTDSGLAAIKTARRNGSWTSLDSVEALEVPPDFQKALNANRLALKNFDRMSPSRKKQLLYRINSAKRSETRLRRITDAVALAAEDRSV